MGETILITGATGFIGQQITRRFISARNVEKLILISRMKKFSPNILKQYGIDAKNIVDYETVTLDLSSPNQVKRLRQYDISLIIHSAGKLGGDNVSRRALLLSNFYATKNIVDYIKGGVEQLIYISSFDVLGPLPASKIPADETFPCNPSNPYEESKMLAERYIFLSDIPWTVIRPEFVYGPGDTHVLPLFKAVISGNFVLINRGESYLHPTCVDDLVQGVELCIRNKKAVREIFNIVGQRYLTVRELAEIIYSTFYDEMSSFHSLNKELLLFPAMIFTAINKILGTDFPLSTSRVRFLTENRAADYKKARDVLGYKPVSLDEGIRETERWYVKNGYL